MSKPLVIYHGGCRDGFCAAWVANRAMPGAEFFPGFYGQPPPDVKDRNVFVIDFSYPRETMDRMYEESDCMLVLDHHKTAEAALAGAEYAIFDMNRSGAGIAWDHFLGGQRHWLVDYVEDRDLWRHVLPDSEVVNSWIGTIPFTFEAWESASLTDMREVIAGGRAVLAKVNQYVAEVRKNARRFQFEGYDVPLVNAPQVDVSELGHALAKDEAFAMAWWQRSDGIFQYSLRSIGDFDVSELAKRHGGGGHKNAAGFQSAVLL